VIFLSGKPSRYATSLRAELHAADFDCPPSEEPRQKFQTATAFPDNREGFLKALQWPVYDRLDPKTVEDSNKTLSELRDALQQIGS